MKHILSTLILAALTTLPAFAGGKKEADGLVYYLPKTAVRVHVLVEKASPHPDSSTSTRTFTSRPQHRR